MPRGTSKHKAAQYTERYGDYAILVLYAIAVAVTYGAMSDPTVLPTYNSGAGLFAFSNTFYTLSGTVITWGVAIASIGGLVAYGTNQFTDEMLNAPEMWKTSEGAAALVVVGLPLAYAFFPSVASAITGTSVIAIVTGGSIFAMFHIVDL